MNEEFKTYINPYSITSFLEERYKIKVHPYFPMYLPFNMTSNFQDEIWYKAYHLYKDVQATKSVIKNFLIDAGVDIDKDYYFGGPFYSYKQKTMNIKIVPAYEVLKIAWEINPRLVPNIISHYNEFTQIGLEPLMLLNSESWSYYEQHRNEAHEFIVTIRNKYALTEDPRDNFRITFDKKDFENALNRLRKCGIDV